jgi:ABC-type transport system involved in multi-copper enzyme maturation permease subunit
MGKLIKSEFLKLSNSRSYKILLACGIGVGLLLGVLLWLMPGTKENGYQIYVRLVSEVQMPAVFASLFAAFFIGSEFADRTFGTGVVSGCVRRNLLIAKTVTYMAGMLVLLLMSPLTVTTLISVVRGFGPWNGAILAHMVRTTLLLCAGYGALGGFCVFFAVLIKNVGGIIGAEFGLLLGLAAGIQIMGLLQLPLPGQILKFIFVYQMAQVSQPESIPLYIGVCAVTLIATLAGAKVVFERAELK